VEIAIVFVAGNARCSRASAGFGAKAPVSVGGRAGRVVWAIFGVGARLSGLPRSTWVGAQSWRRWVQRGGATLSVTDFGLVASLGHEQPQDLIDPGAGSGWKLSQQLASRQRESSHPCFMHVCQQPVERATTECWVEYCGSMPLVAPSHVKANAS
jgi:hypothetical protein